MTNYDNWVTALVDEMMEEYTNYDNWVTALVDEMMEEYTEKEEIKLSQLNLIIDRIESTNEEIDRMILKSTRLNPYEDSEIISEVYHKISILKGHILNLEDEIERIDKRLNF